MKRFSMIGLRNPYLKYTIPWKWLSYTPLSITFQPENSPRFFAWFIPAAVGYAEFQVLNDASMNYNAAAAG